MAQTYLGCYEDQKVARDLDGSGFDLTNLNTVDLCAEKCATRGEKNAEID